MKCQDQPCKKIELQDTGSTLPKICRGSRSIRKSSTVGPLLQARKPVVIYVRSPKVVHADPQNFMALVQRLSGFCACEKTPVKREAEGEAPQPSIHAPSQSMINLCFDENVNNISPLVVDDVDELGMGADRMFHLEWANLCGTGGHFQPFISSSPHVQHSDLTISDLSMSSSTNIEVFSNLQNVCKL